MIRFTNGALADQSGHVVRGTQTVPAFPQESVSFAFRTGASVSVSLPAATGGEGGLTYALGSQALPTGLAYNAPGRTDTHGGTITGNAPATAQASTAYTVSATDGDGDSDTITVLASATVSDEGWSARARGGAPFRFALTQRNGLFSMRTEHDEAVVHARDAKRRSDVHHDALGSPGHGDTPAAGRLSARLELHDARASRS